MRITVIGCGYVGLVTGLCLADLGHTISFFDKDEKRITDLVNGKLPIYEPDLQKLLAKHNSGKNVSFRFPETPINLERYVSKLIGDSEVIFLTVGTPGKVRGYGYADLSYVYEAAGMIASSLKGYTVIVNKSTVPVGTAHQVERIIHDLNPKADFDMVSNPEFLREGSAVYDFMKPDRIVIGTSSVRAFKVMESVYIGEGHILNTDIQTAELIKYASNAFLATKISFINEMANLCDAIGSDVEQLAEGMGLDHRIGKEFLRAGPGYGGSCFPKDTLALVRMAQEHGQTLRVIEATIEANNAQKSSMVKKIRDALGGSETGKTIAILGCTFKPDTDDIRESPAVTIISVLAEKGAILKVCDPKATAAMQNIFSEEEVKMYADMYHACAGADAVVLMTEWNYFDSIDLKVLSEIVKQKIFVDLRNRFRPEYFKSKGFMYVGVGKQ